MHKILTRGLHTTVVPKVSGLTGNIGYELNLVSTSKTIRGVDGSCAEYLTVESYTVVICQRSYLVFHHPLTLSFQA